MIEPIVLATSLRKRFEDVTAVEDVSLSIQPGEFFGFLGPNGAGKTTTINMLTGLARPDSGRLQIAGIECTGNVKAAQHLIGVVPDESNLYPELTGLENLAFCGALYGMERTARKERAALLLESFGLAEAGSRKFGGYSRGMKRKLTIAAGIIHEPPILFLDEPTTGIDVESARHIRKLLSELHGTGTTVFLTTHYIEEAERLCGRIAFIVNGRVVRQDSLDNLLAPVKGVCILRVQCSGSLDETVLADLSRVFPRYVFNTEKGSILFVKSEEAFPISPLVGFLAERGFSVLEAVRRRPSLEDVFVSVTGIGSDQMKKEGMK
ncbi:MAG: ABC transporter ATP-binding protein [Candidatus Fermentibacteraceae bacterium]